MSSSRPSTLRLPTLVGSGNKPPGRNVRTASGFGGRFDSCAILARRNTVWSRICAFRTRRTPAVVKRYPDDVDVYMCPGRVRREKKNITAPRGRGTTSSIPQNVYERRSRVRCAVSFRDIKNASPGRRIKGRGRAGKVVWGRPLNNSSTQIAPAPSPTLHPPSTPFSPTLPRPTAQHRKSDYDRVPVSGKACRHTRALLLVRKYGGYEKKTKPKSKPSVEFGRRFRFVFNPNTRKTQPQLTLRRTCAPRLYRNSQVDFRF